MGNAQHVLSLSHARGGGVLTPCGEDNESSVFGAHSDSTLPCLCPWLVLTHKKL